jgi:hypothetical protein
VRQDVRQRWFSGRALALDLAILFWFPGCLVAFWWQVNRAFDGNGLSYLYSVEWPVFAVVGVWGWWMLIHTDPATVGRRAQEKLAAARAGATGASADGAADLSGGTGTVRHREDEDDALAAYNDRLATLAEQGPKTWRHR